MKRLILALVFAAAACGAPTQIAPEASPPAEAAVEHNAPPGEYRLEKSHASLIVRLGHMGYSQFTARFETWDATLDLDVAAPENSSINVTIDPRSIASDNPPAGFIDIMRGADFLNAAQFPEIGFRSTQIERTGPNTARIVGDLTLHGVTRPVTLQIQRFKCMPHPVLKREVCGADAFGTFERDEFGLTAGKDYGFGMTVTLRVQVEAVLAATAAASAAGPATAAAAAAAAR